MVGVFSQVLAIENRANCRPAREKPRIPGVIEIGTDPAKLETTPALSGDINRVQRARP
jgi:hypothetical protein